ncbi:Tn3 family transposase [Streptomyces sp. NPDC056257]|uniref:Tn3 family transposase n=1 Tax=Streptomyces sp. NPDC056257 TaxID=3345765 RepID=UPI0035DCC9CA
MSEGICTYPHVSDQHSTFDTKAIVAHGHPTASPIVGRLSASSRQNALAAALKEDGAIRWTTYAAKYLSDPTYRRQNARQLNKGESLHRPGLAQLDEQGHRPLRTVTTDDPGAVLPWQDQAPAGVIRQEGRPTGSS